MKAKSPWLISWECRDAIFWLLVVVLCLTFISPVIAGQSRVAYAAIDAREVIVDAQTGLANVPAHIDHVLASPKREFAGNGWWGSQWEVAETKHARPNWVDTSYLSHPDNITVVRTYFGFDDFHPSDLTAALALVADQQGNKFRFLVVGHADEVGSLQYNMSLSLKRAHNVRSILIQAGVSGDDLKVIGRGKTDPASLHDQSLNRRVEIVIRGDASAKEAYLAAVQKAQAMKAASIAAAKSRARQEAAANQPPAPMPSFASQPRTTATQRALNPVPSLNPAGDNQHQPFDQGNRNGRN